MSILFYKQRHRNPNRKDTAGANYAHVRYIAIRRGVMNNKGMNHGLFGKLEPGIIQEFEDWREVARQVYSNSKKGTVMYRSVVSFVEETAKELLLKDQKSWQRYIENHILTIAEKNGIKREHLQWAAAVHGEKKHPHIHIVFWDTSVRVQNPYTSPKIPDAIRKQMIKDTFAEKILAYAREKDSAIRELRQITNYLIEQFENNLRCKKMTGYKQIEKMLNTELDTEAYFDEKLLQNIAEQLFLLKGSLPKEGRLSYQFLSLECKEKVDDLVAFLLSMIPEIKQCFDRYVDAKYRMAKLYAMDETILAKQKGGFEKEAEKILANRVLSGVKMLLRLESENRTIIYMERRREYFASRLLLDALNTLAQTAWKQEEDYYNYQNTSSDLSKEAKKELFMKNQDKGYEH
ncbi:hypothetical protein EDD76_108207 [Kineothrix alysoides]|uniref:Uncharacterized protein n=1 Tax=Kineothrix alysoides TaxID=1469948 RepID=A0A4V2QBU1_9FIRM|nr:MobP3 family relaxase [Kineothrix alysoides]TCL57672.1 hypothetical protein EDD76_108207 [Kineothrix alysoides]